ncbi:MAG: indolepyruvate ferredoxin oxidoreductase subunit alpha [Actinobacteria bacterium HGW-Actinobacteria-1]|jgi:indolepyruvate ferredoxin oxidoreductase alpha subunit|nr:MAG: indolepyruvate ferredoxin oxidoreductase subunit alpha [Actinobacteria bacterium HGW-Actinobacteria-1]
MSGNEAVARGAWESGVSVGVGYPGTPSTEVLENLSKYDDVNCQWAPNEKVAAEVGAGVSYGGKRALVTMKHVGLNVAADPLFTLSYIGVGGGYVLLVADDPGMHSSQNEQDSRNYAAFAKVPMLEPSDSQEMLAFTRAAFDISEQFDTPVLIRSTTRISHSKSLVEVGERRVAAPVEFKQQPGKWVMMPANARARRVDLAARLERLSAFSNECDLNRIEMRDPGLGIVCSGIVYEYVREALPEASILKIGMVNPLPEALIAEFASKVERLAVVEELDPYLTSRLKALGIKLVETGLSAIGELSPGLIARAFGAEPAELRDAINDLPPRPPLLCPGCPHRGVYWALGKLKAVVTGDIGCYTLGALPPLSAMDTCVCMGASVGMAHGLGMTGATEGRPVVGVIGDSTFAHSGITGVLDMVYNGAEGTIVILDNRTTAMTGHQGNPVSGKTLVGDPAPALDLVALCTALGVRSVRTVDPLDMTATLAALTEETERDGLSVIIAKSPCALIVRSDADPVAIDEELCTRCGVCVRLGCPAIMKLQTGQPVIDTAICVGCGQCVQVCRYNAIVTVGPACDFGGGLK